MIFVKKSAKVIKAEGTNKKNDIFLRKIFFVSKTSLNFVPRKTKNRVQGAEHGVVSRGENFVFIIVR